MAVATGAKIYIKGIDQLEKAANKAIKSMNEGKTKLIYEQAKKVRNRIKEKAPRGETGNLKAAAYASYIPPKLGREVFAFAGIRPRKAPHAHLVEFGHGGPHPAPPHPFFRPAWDEMKSEVRRNIEEGLKKAVEGSF
jgi:HK97 gp10 family phage protein